MSIPNRILDSSEFRAFMEWFEFVALLMFIIASIVIVLLGIVGLGWWLL